MIILLSTIFKFLKFARSLEVREGINTQNRLLRYLVIRRDNFTSKTILYFQLLSVGCSAITKYALFLNKTSQMLML